MLAVASGLLGWVGVDIWFNGGPGCSIGTAGSLASAVTVIAGASADETNWACGNGVYRNLVLL